MNIEVKVAWQPLRTVTHYCTCTLHDNLLYASCFSAVQAASSRDSAFARTSALVGFASAYQGATLQIASASQLGSGLVGQQLARNACNAIQRQGSESLSSARRWAGQPDVYPYFSREGASAVPAPCAPPPSFEGDFACVKTRMISSSGFWSLQCCPTTHRKLGDYR